MNRKGARIQLKSILKNQKTVSTSRLQRIIDVIDIDGCERQRVEMAKKLKRLKENKK